MNLFDTTRVSNQATSTKDNANKTNGEVEPTGIELQFKDLGKRMAETLDAKIDTVEGLLKEARGLQSDMAKKSEFKSLKSNMLSDYDEYKKDLLIQNAKHWRWRWFAILAFIEGNLFILWFLLRHVYGYI